MFDIIFRHLPSSIKDGVSMCVNTVCGALSEQRALPGFIIIGAQKAGTTSLFEYLMQHPNIRTTTKKEVHYFDHAHQKGAHWYRGHFPFTWELAKDGAITGEATPQYLFHPYCAERIHNLVPGVKLIALLRNPVDRAISHYSQAVRFGREPLPISEALVAEEERLATEIEKMRTDPTYRSYSYQYYSYKSRGIYIDQLERYMRLFQRDQLLIINAEDLFSDPGKILSEVHGFLGVDRTFLPDDLKPRNVGNNSMHVPDEVHVYLNDFFRPHNKRLYDYLGRDYGW